MSDFSLQMAVVFFAGFKFSTLSMWREKCAWGDLGHEISA
jgi:hypothetical protein